MIVGVETFSGPDTCRDAGITYRQLDYWTRRGFIRPVGKSNPGSGAQRRYTAAEVEIARVLGVLSRQSLHPKAGGLYEAVSDGMRSGERTVEVCPGLLVDVDRLAVADPPPIGFLMRCRRRRDATLPLELPSTVCDAVRWRTTEGSEFRCVLTVHGDELAHVYRWMHPDEDRGRSFGADGDNPPPAWPVGARSERQPAGTPAGPTA